MRVLVLGGTGFLGRHLTRALLASGHEPTLLHRGRTAPELFGELEHLLADRAQGLALPRERRWDAAIDTCGYVPRVVAANARELRARVDRLCFVSSESVYADHSRAGLTEEAPLVELADPATETVTPATYGGLKVLCERAVTEAFPHAHVIVRPGLIVGPHDSQERFPYWVWRLAQGGDVLVPAPASAPCQLIDARDLAAWIVRLLEDGASGAFHASGPADRELTFGELVEACRAPGVDARLVWVDGEFLVAAGLEPWFDLPFWTHLPKLRGLFAIDLARARASGLRTRSPADSARDVRAWLSESGPRRWHGAPTPERDRELLDDWRAWRDRRAAR